MKKGFDWEEYYSISFRKSMALSLAIIIALILILPKECTVTPYRLRKEVVTIMEELPPELEKIAEPPPMERPKLPVAAESDKEAEEATIAPTEFPEITKKPTQIEVPTVPFWKVESPPKPKYIPKPKYPEIARQAGIEGQVIVNALVDVDGTVREAKVIKSSGNPALDAEALRVAKGATFTPARQRDRLVRVWVAIPVIFSLKEER